MVVPLKWFIVIPLFHGLHDIVLYAPRDVVLNTNKFFDIRYELI
jgi:hypothetical protein